MAKQMVCHKVNLTLILRGAIFNLSSLGLYVFAMGLFHEALIV